MVHVPYKGAGAVLQDLMGGQVQALISAVPTVVPYVNARRLRALMVTDDKRTRVLPDVPSAKEAGLPQMVMQFWVGYAVPALHPPNPEPEKRFAELGLDTVVTRRHKRRNSLPTRWIAGPRSSRRRASKRNNGSPTVGGKRNASKTGDPSDE